jgi:hypothetical protein
LHPEWLDREEDEDEYLNTASGAWDAMEICPWLDAPRPGDLLDQDHLERVKKWVWSPLGQDAPLGEIAEQVTARARAYYMSEEL